MSRLVPLRFDGRSVGASITLRDRIAVLEREGSRLDARFTRDGTWLEIVSGDRVVRAATARDARGIWVSIEGRTYLFEIEHRAGGAHAAAEEGGEVRAPMTGRVASVDVEPGARVLEGSLLITIEAMKMEFKLVAPGDGTVAEVTCAPGDLVELGQLVARMTLDSDGTPSA